MKAIRSPKAKQLASALLVALTLTTVLSLSIVGYLTVVEQQNLLGARSQTWNMSIAVVEAGIEEALEQLNCNGNSLSADGWAFDGTYYTMTRTLPDGNSYDVKINDSDPTNPDITCRADVTPPTFVRKALPYFFASLGSPSVTPVSVHRAVRVRTSKGNLFTAALVARRNINLNGNGIYTDSYDSTDSTKSTAGKYDSSKYSGNHGDVACNGGVTNSSVSVGNANIYGIIHTGPMCPVSFLPNGGVGPHGAQTSDLTTAKNLGYILEDANFTFPDTSLPSDYATYLTPTAGSIVTWSNNITSWGTNSTVAPNPPPWGGTVTNNNPSYSSTYPNPPPTGLTTNISGYSTVNTYPVPTPGGLTTNNINYTQQSSLPNPPYYNASTNYTTQLTTTSGYPTAGTYTGSVTTNYSGASGNTKTYTYNYITKTTYNYTLRTYTYPNYVYVTPHYTYSYSLYQTNTIYTTNSYDYILNANTKYQASSLNGKVCVAGPNVLLVMPNGLTGQENFTFNAGAAVQVYSGGTSCTINGNQYLNPNYIPGSFVVYCTPSVTSFTLNGNGSFTGVLVAPNANIAMNGSGSNNEDFCGSLMVNSCTMNGHFSFHYDESLSHMPSNGRFLISAWDEIDPSTF